MPEIEMPEVEMADTDDQAEQAAAGGRKPLSPAARRALEEAAARRAAATEPGEAPQEAPKEIGGRDGPEPTRYGDWEKKGIISDF